MSHIYKELEEIPIPENAHVNKYNNRVFLMTKVNGKRNQIVIGKSTSATMMHPNTSFRYLFPDDWNRYYHEKIDKPYTLYAGMYAITLAIGHITKLYQIAIDAYNPVNANAIMDYAMYSILHQSSTTQLFQDQMADQVHFSEKLRNENWYGKLFHDEMNENVNHKFLDMWADRCKERGIKHVWLSIDGSNSDCNSENSTLAEKGKAKSHTSSNIISYIWAIDAETGTPVTYRVNNGSMVDSRALAEISAYLKERDIEIDGVILDCGFCTHQVIEMLQKNNQEYILMLKSNTYGHTKAYEEYAEEIRWKVNHIVSERGVFGISCRDKLFKNHDECSYINLYFDGINGGERAVSLIKNVLKYRDEITQNCQKEGGPSIPAQVKKYLKVTTVKGKKTITIDNENWQTAINEKGYYSIASSQNLGEQRVYELYHKRDASEKQFSILKTQLDFDSVRVHSDKSIRGRYALCFIAAILRSEIMNIARKHNISTNKFIVEMNRVILTLSRNESYQFINNLSQRQKDIFLEFGLEPSNFERIAHRFTVFTSKEPHGQIHQDPFVQVDDHSKKRGRPPVKKAEGTVPKTNKKRGRPKGSKNKKTIEKELKEQTK